MFAAIYAAEGSDAGVLLDVGRAFSPRVEAHLPREVVLDLDGLTRLFGDARTIGAEIRRTAADRKLQIRVAIAGSRVAARLLARHRAGFTLAAHGATPALHRDGRGARIARRDDQEYREYLREEQRSEAGCIGRRMQRGLPHGLPTSDGDIIDAESDRAAVAAVPLELLADIWADGARDDGVMGQDRVRAAQTHAERARDGHERVRTLRRWGLRTLGELAALPPDDVAARLGSVGADWWHMARGKDLAPLVPSLPEERFEQALDLEWPIEGFEPLSFVLGRLFEPLSAHLERRDRGVAVLRLRLHLVTKAVHELALQLPTPMRDPKALRTLALLALESNPAPAGIDRVVVAADPTPGRVIQHSLLTRAVPMPEELATLMARLDALMGEGRCGSPMVIDTWKPGAHAVAPFVPDTTSRDIRPAHGASGSLHGHVDEGATGDPWNRKAIPAETLSLDGHVDEGATGDPWNRKAIPAETLPLHGHVDEGATGGPWNRKAIPAETLSLHGHVDEGATGGPAKSAALALRRFRSPVSARVTVEQGRPVRVVTDRRGLPGGRIEVSAGPWRTSGNWWEEDKSAAGAVSRSALAAWDRDEWDVTLADGATYRLFTERGTRAWFVDGLFD